MKHFFRLLVSHLSPHWQHDKNPDWYCRQCREEAKIRFEEERGIRET